MVLKKILRWILAILLIVGIIFGSFICVQYNKLKPDYSGSFKLPGISGTTLVAWDSSGVVHIQGGSTDDVIFASGFAAAKERLWQMELSRRVAKGQLSEIFGNKTLKIDKMFLTLGIDSITQVLYQKISLDSRRWLQQYAAGVNAYLKTMGDELPIEFILMKFKPRAWTPQDCLLQNRLMAWFLNFNWKADLLYWQLLDRLPRNKFNEIWPKWSRYPDILSLKKPNGNLSRLLRIDQEAREIVGLTYANWGSNNWVIAPARTGKGFALLANDPHLAFQFPGIWIEMHLKSKHLNVAGFAFPGTPGIVIGRNEKIAWGLTNGMIDDSDFFIEKVDTTAGFYFNREGKHRLSVQTRRIKIKGQQDVYYSIYRTNHGPVFNSLFPSIGNIPFISFKWTGYSFSDELKTFIDLAHAQNWGDFEHALQTFGIPCQNFVYADHKGNIGYRLGGRVPVRSYPNGLIPRSAWSTQNIWENWIPFDEMPAVLNPDSGFIVTANNRIAKDYPYYLSELWEPPYRALRIRQLIRNAGGFDAEKMGKIQMDNLSLLSRELNPILVAELKKNPLQSQQAQDVLLLLSNWKGEMVAEKIAPTVFETTQYFLIKNIFFDEMGKDLFRVFTDLPNFYLRVFVQVLIKKNSPWFDDISTPQIESRQEIVAKSFRQALEFLNHRIGSDTEDWAWGNLHHLELTHALGKVALTKLIFNKGPYPLPGNGTTVNVASYRYNNPFKVVAGPSMRFIVDWSVPGMYWSVLPGGNSGNFLSPFYSNQIQNWLNGRLKKVSMRWHQKWKIISLKPAQNY